MNKPEAATFYTTVQSLKARGGPLVEKFAIVQENLKLYRFVPGNADEDDSDTDADTIEPTGGGAGRWKRIAHIASAQADDVGALTDDTTGTASSTISDVGGAFSQSTLNDNFASLAEQINDIRTALRDAGLMA
jgi:hypothetical protein